MTRAMRAIAKASIALIAIALSTLIVEAGLRLVRHPMDYLEPILVNDPILGIRLAPGSGGHDGWGFRNPVVPEHADVVAIGDSQTWGVAARWEESWPSWYSRMTKRDIYNFGIGGYGPAEYRYLLETKALTLAPKQIIVGMYLGNDLRDAYFAVTTHRHWESLHTENMPPYPVEASAGTASRVIPELAPIGPIKLIRSWFRRNSMLFRIIEAGPIGQRINAFGDRTEGLSRAGCVVTTTDPFPTVFHPEDRFEGMDLADPSMVEGLDLTLEFVGQMADVASQNGVGFMVVVLPTKESVMMVDMDPPTNDCERVLRRVIASEVIIAGRVRDYLDQHGIAYVEPLEAMRAEARIQPIYLRSADSHPNGQGYRVIAEQIVNALAPVKP